MDPGDDVQLPDLLVIQRYSLAVRGATAPAADVIEALQSDLAWLTGSSRPRSAPPARKQAAALTKPAAPTKPAAVKPAAAKQVAAKPVAKKSAAKKSAATRSAAKPSPVRQPAGAKKKAPAKRTGARRA